MKRIITILIVTIFSLDSNVSYAQHEMSLYSATGRAGVATTMATDYQTIGINPANLALKPSYEGKKITFGLLETAISAYSNALIKSELQDAISNYNSTTFNYQQKLEAARKFTGSSVAINADVNLLGVSYQTEKNWGIAFGVKERFQWYSQFNSNVADLMFRGYTASYFDSLQLMNDSVIVNNEANYTQYQEMIKRGFAINPQLFSKIFDGSQINMTWYREYNLSVGHGIYSTENFSLSGGVGLKYIQGFSILDARVEGGKLIAFGAFSPRLGIDFGNAAKSNPSTVENQTSGVPKPVGSGFGADAGITIVLKQKTKIGLAITNLGSVTYTGNVYEALDTLLFDMKSGGFNNYNFFAESEKIAGQQGLFKWSGKTKINVPLPTMIRAGASHVFLDDKMEVGADIVIPAKEDPGNFETSVMSLGIEFRALPWIHFSTGLSRGGNFDNKINFPVGVRFLSGKRGTWEAGIASRDVITYFSEDSPLLSVAFGFLRFRI